MKLKKKLPVNRSFDQVKNHYLVEKSLADKLKSADRNERRIIYSTMYEELFSKVPDHPRLLIRDDDKITAKVNKTKFGIVKDFINSSTVFAEFGPGDCRFALKIADIVNKVYAIDISDQRNSEDKFPNNFELVIYDGYDTDKILDESIDVLFSDQLIEHFHPDDTENHFLLAHKLLKYGGIYIFKTPHALLGPLDVSQYFCDEAEGFHLKEWQFREISHVLKKIGYSRIKFFWTAKGYKLRLPNLYFYLYENIMGLFPKRYTRKISKFAIPSLMCIAKK